MFRVQISVGSLSPQAELYDKATSFTLDDGYTSVAIAGFILSGNGYTNCMISRLSVIGSNIMWSIKNMSSSLTCSNIVLTVYVTEGLSAHSNG